jgi:UDP-glucose 4-epimerase
MKFLITGVAGLLGSRMAEWLLENTDHVVVGIDDLSGGFLENLPEESDRFVFYKQDVTNRAAIDKIFEKEVPQYVYHMSAYAAECVSPFIRCYNYNNNIIGTASIVNACIKHNVIRLVFTSSMAIYGDQKAPFHEDMQYMPVDPYGVAKMGCEIDIKIAGVQHELDWCIIRPHNLFGENQNLWDSYRNFIGIAMYKGLVGDPITVYGNGKQTRAFSEVTDCLKPLYMAALDVKASKQIINLGGVHEYSINHVAKIVSELSGVDIIHLPKRHEVKHAYATWDKSVEILGFEHKTSLGDGILNMWEWAKKQPLRERFVWEEYEITNELYPQWEKQALKDGYYNRKSMMYLNLKNDFK